MAKTYLDELVEFPLKAIHLIGSNPTVVQLLTNNPNIDMNSDEADQIYDRYIFDYAYVDSTTEEAEAYICVESEVPNVQSMTIKNMKLFVTVFCHKKYMSLDPTKFEKLSGNRRDNLTRYIDLMLNGSEIFGIGKLSLESARIVSSPNNFTARELVYEVPEFKIKPITTGA